MVILRIISTCVQNNQSSFLVYASLAGGHHHISEEI